MVSIHRSWNCAKVTSEVLLKDSCDVDAEEGNYWTLLSTSRQLLSLESVGVSFCSGSLDNLVFAVASVNLTS